MSQQVKPTVGKREGRFDLVRNWQLYAMVALPLALLILFSYVPMTGIVIAFKDYSLRRGIWGSDWVGMKHFENFLTSPIFKSMFQNTLILSVYSFLAGYFVPILLALCLNEISRPLVKKGIQMVTFFPYMISVVVMTGMLMQFFHLNGGFVNNIIRMLGGTPKDFMGDKYLFRHLYTWSGVWQTAGYSAVIYIAALSGVDPQITESAVLDGVNRIQKIRYIDLPSIAPTITITLILGLGSLMSIGHEKAYLMQNDLNIEYSELISTYIYKRGLLTMQFSYSTAIGLFNSVINIVLLVFANTISHRLNGNGLW